MMISMTNLWYWRANCLASLLLDIAMHCTYQFILNSSIAKTFSDHLDELATMWLLLYRNYFPNCTVILLWIFTGNILKASSSWIPQRGKVRE